MTNESYNYDALFNPEVETGTPQQSTTANEYKPSAAKGKNKIYQSLIRFIPFWEDPRNKSMMIKWSCWLEDPISKKGKPIDCPSSVGKSSILQDMYRKYKYSDSVMEQKKAEIFSRKQEFYSLVQIIKDENAPELEGKILVYKYGKKIWEKINAEKKPIVGTAHDPFELLTGKIFALIITEQVFEKNGKKINSNNYDQSKFLDKSVALCIPNEQGKLIPINDKTNKSVVLNFLKENSPNLNEYGFNDWDQETQEYVNNVVAAVTGQPVTSTSIASIQQSVQNQTPTSRPNVQTQSPHQSNSGITTSDISLDDINNIPDISSELPDIDVTGLGGDLQDALSGL